MLIPTYLRRGVIVYSMSCSKSTNVFFVMIKLGCHILNMTIAKNMSVASKIYRYTSVESKTPSCPPTYSTTLNVDRIMMRALALYRTRRYFCHGVFGDNERVVGCEDSR